MAKKSYSQATLTYVASQIKRQLINRVKKDPANKFTKTEVFELIARKLDLKSARTLWLGNSRLYLDEWYFKLEQQIQELLDETPTKHHSPTIETTDINQLQSQLKMKDTLIREYEKVIAVLRQENEYLRLRVIDKHGKINF